MKIIGITGGIGSGKSVVCKVFQSLGIPVFNSDSHAKIVYDEFPETLEKLKERYGQDIISDNKLDRRALASIVFESEKELTALNNLVHPFVKLQFENWRSKQNSPYLLREAAILFESKSNMDCDDVILVSAPIDLRIRRTMKRDNMTEDQVKHRINMQWPDEKKRELSGFEIINDELRAILPQVLAIHEKLIKG